MTQPDFAREVWEKMSTVDVGEYIEKKGRYSYLSWAWAWATLKKTYPATTARFQLEVFADGTGQIECILTIADGLASLEGAGWLPVLDHKNQPIKNPSAADINNTKMRALVKTIAMVTGLGLYIFAGEDMPEKPAEKSLKCETTARLKEQAEIIGRENIPEEITGMARSSDLEKRKNAVARLDAMIEQQSGEKWTAVGA